MLILANPFWPAVTEAGNITMGETYGDDKNVKFINHVVSRICNYHTRSCTQTSTMGITSTKLHVMFNACKIFRLNFSIGRLDQYNAPPIQYYGHVNVPIWPMLPNCPRRIANSQQDVYDKDLQTAR